MISFQKTSIVTTTTQQESSDTHQPETTYSKYEPIIVSGSIILGTAIIFVLIKDIFKGFLMKRRDR